MGDNYNMVNSNTVDSKCSSKVDESISLPSAPRSPRQRRLQSHNFSSIICPN